jgi:hypothetical protein
MPSARSRSSASIAVGGADLAPSTAVTFTIAAPVVTPNPPDGANVCLSRRELARLQAKLFLRGFQAAYDIFVRKI